MRRYAKPRPEGRGFNRNLSHDGPHYIDYPALNFHTLSQWKYFSPEEGVPQHDHVEHQAERTGLVFLPLAIVLPQLASLAVEDGAGDAVPPLATVELSQRAPALGFVIDVDQRVQRLVDAAEAGSGCH